MDFSWQDGVKLTCINLFIKERVEPVIKKRRYIILVGIVLIIFLLLSGCLPTKKYETKPDYAVTEQVALEFMGFCSRGELDQALQYVSDEVILSTDSGQMKGKEVIKEMLKVNCDKDNQIEVLEKKKIDNSKIELIVSNKIPLFQIAGVDVIKTKETLEVQDGKIVKWEIKHLKESVDLVAKVASGTPGVETEVKEGQIVITKVLDKTPARHAGLKKGDIILAIDGLELKDMKYGEEEIPYRMIGEVGSYVNLEISRDGETFDLDLRRVDIDELE